MNVAISDSPALLAVHHLPAIMPFGAPADHFAEIIPASGFNPASCQDAVVTSTEANPASDISAMIEQFNAWRQSASAAAKLEGGDGFLIGYDPLNPLERLPASEIEATDECLFRWDRSAGGPPIFEWKDVVHLDAAPDVPTASIYLTEGRAVFFHADIDWWNLLS